MHGYDPSGETAAGCSLLIDLTGRRCVVVGGGSVAARRVRTLLAGGASVIVIAPDVGAELRAVDEPGLTIERRPYRDGDLAGAFLVVSATGDEAVDATVADDARARGCLLSAGFDGDAGDTRFPAEMRRGALRISVSTGGASPTVAGTIRRELEERYGPEWGPYVASLSVLRNSIRATDLPESRRRRLLGLAAEERFIRIVSEHADDPQGLLERLEAAADECTAGPFVSLVGGGPGDPDLVTTKGLARIRACDVLIYDHLVDERLVRQAPMHAERIYVGKRGGHEYMKQPEIERLLIAKATEDGGQAVVRLKGGDPYVFGRGGEEALALTEAGVPFEVVPGVSAGVAAPAAAGIPVTHRGLSTSVTFVTGHEDPTKGRDDVDWPRIGASAETICVFMGVRNAAAIAEGLMRGGRPDDEPVAVIRWGTTPRQKTLVSALGTLARDIERAGITPPALLVIGRVVGLRERLGHTGDRCEPSADLPGSAE